MPKTTPADILNFGFGRPGEADHGQPRGEWLSKDARVLPSGEATRAGA